MRVKRSEQGQAAVELVAILPLIAALAALLWQALVAGQALWLTSSAARAAARTEAVRGGDGTATVRTPVPSVGGGAPVTTITATAHMEPQR